MLKYYADATFESVVDYYPNDDLLFTRLIAELSKGTWRGQEPALHFIVSEKGLAFLKNLSADNSVLLGMHVASCRISRTYAAIGIGDGLENKEIYRNYFSIELGSC